MTPGVVTCENFKSVSLLVWKFIPVTHTDRHTDKHTDRQANFI